MTDLQDLQARYEELRTLHARQSRTIGAYQTENEELKDLLREFITPPLAYSKKQDAVAKARMLLEEWKEVER